MDLPVDTRRVPWRAIIVSICIAALLVVSSVHHVLISHTHWENEQLIASAPVHTTATIVDVVARQKNRYNHTYTPVVEMVSGNERHRVELESSDDKDQYVEGDQLSVTYQDGNPGTAVDTSRRAELGEVVTPDLVIGIVALGVLAALGGWLISTRWRRRRKA